MIHYSSSNHLTPLHTIKGLHHMTDSASRRLIYQARNGRKTTCVRQPSRVGIKRAPSAGDKHEQNAKKTTQDAPKDRVAGLRLACRSRGGDNGGPPSARVEAGGVSAATSYHIHNYNLLVMKPCDLVAKENFWEKRIYRDCLERRVWRERGGGWIGRTNE